MKNKLTQSLVTVIVCFLCQPCWAIPLSSLVISDGIEHYTNVWTSSTQRGIISYYDLTKFKNVKIDKKTAIFQKFKIKKMGSADLPDKYSYTDQISIKFENIDGTKTTYRYGLDRKYVKGIVKYFRNSHAYVSGNPSNSFFQDDVEITESEFYKENTLMITMAGNQNTYVFEVFLNSQKVDSRIFSNVKWIYEVQVYDSNIWFDLVDMADKSSTSVVTSQLLYGECDGDCDLEKKYTNSLKSLYGGSNSYSIGSTTINSDLSFCLPNANYYNLFGDGMNLEMNFIFFGEQNKKLLWELDSFKVK
jgi:hypothetical protein